jgi:hypothetical protein
MENYISMVQRKPWIVISGRKINKWVIVQNVEPEINLRKRHGKWLVVLTNRENECN